MPTGYDPIAMGERLARAREKRGETPEQLAVYAGTSGTTVRALERGDRSCSIRLASALAQYLSISLDWLVWGKRS